MSAPPRHFIDFTVPQREDGSPLVNCSQPGDYETYLHWLADYLHAVELPLSPVQQEWLGRFQGTPTDLIFHCSDSFGYDVDWLEGIDNHIKEGMSYQEFKDYMEPHWRECNEDYEDLEDQWSFDDYLAITEEGYEARRLEIEEMGDDSPYWSHADIPFRSLLCHALRKIPSHEERFHELDFYFRNFAENASK
jgi:hypothetical protein